MCSRSRRELITAGLLSASGAALSPAVPTWAQELGTSPPPHAIDSLATGVELQADPALLNAQSGFFLADINTFTEWPEGTRFEPAKHRRALPLQERACGYHPHKNGAWRLELLQAHVRPFLHSQ